MNVTIFPKAISKLKSGFSRVRGLILKRKGPAILVAAVLLAPLEITGNGGAFLLNAILLGGAALLVWSFAMSLRKKRTKR